MKNFLSKIKSWDELKSKLSKLDNKQKGDAFELLSKYYLLLDPKYSSILSDVWLLDEVPLAVSKKLNLPSSDQGIDLIAKTKQGEYWAVQCKYRQEDSSSLRWKEISTFLGLVHSRCKNISYSLITTTKNRLAKVLDDADNLGLLAGDTWRGLDDDFFKRLRAALKNKKVQIKPYKPFKHQKRAIKNAVNHFVTEKESRGKMIMPCGAGKSLTAYWMAESLESKSILIAVPSLSLVRQTLNAWLREVEANKIDAQWICVCSDKSVGDLKADEIEYLNHDLAVPALTDVNYIAKWLRKRRSGLSIVFTTYQSGKVISSAAKIAKKSFDLGIMDEAHKTVGNKDKNFAHLLFDKNIKIKKRCFMTATERRFQGSKDDIISMDDIDVYGDTFDLLSFKEALEQKPPILSDYKIITIGVSEDSIKEMIKKNFFVKPDKGTWTKKMEAEMMAALIALRKAIKDNNIKHALSFHSSISKAKIFAKNQSAFTEVFKDYGNLDTFHVSGKMNTSDRDKIIKEDFLNSKRALITNARCLTEGIDVKDIDCVLFADPKKSTIDIVQAVGRALRIKEGKKFGYVIVPVILEKEKDFKDTKAYESILMVLRALAANDDRIIEYFKAKNNNQRTNINVDIQIDEKIAKGVNTKEIVKDIEINVWNRLAKLSWMPFEEARAIIHTLNLKSNNYWKDYINGKIKNLEPLPSDIPKNPRGVYKDMGWISMGDWLGTGRIADQFKLKSLFIDYKKAKSYVNRLQIKSVKEWNSYSKGIHPTLNKKPDYIPSNPQRAYKNNGWESWSKWLGVKIVATFNREFRDYNEAIKFVHKLKLKNQNEWNEYIKGNIKDKPPLPDDIPKSPMGVYKDNGWINFSYWIGTYTSSFNVKFISFKNAKKYVRKLGIKTEKEWFKYCVKGHPKYGEKPHNIPKYPEKIYKNEGWKSRRDFYGNKELDNFSKNFKSFKDARNHIRKLGFKTGKEFHLYCKGEHPVYGMKPNYIPANPDLQYKNKGWKGMEDWLGVEKSIFQKRKFVSYNDASEFAKSKNIQSSSEWEKLKNKIPLNIPRSPVSYYKKTGDWTSWGDFLDTGRVADQLKIYIDFDKLKKIVQSKSIKSMPEYRKWVKTLNNFKYKNELVPVYPERPYKKQWIDAFDFLGNTKRKTNKGKKINKVFIPFDELKKIVIKAGINSYSEYKKWASNKIKKNIKAPSGLPKDPRAAYVNKGWIDTFDFLGKKKINFWSFNKSHNYIKKIRLKNAGEWRLYTKGQLKRIKSKKPDEIPANPDKVYENKGWKDWPHFLGTGKISKIRVEFWSYNKVKKYIAKYNLRAHTWRKYVLGEIPGVPPKPIEIPNSPESYYIKTGEWIGFSDFVSNVKNYFTYKEAKEFINKNYPEIKTLMQYKEFHAKIKPDRLPLSIADFYKKRGEWISSYDFFGTKPSDRNKSG